MSERSAAANSEPVEAAGGAMELVARGARDGAADARAAAERTWEAASLFASRFTYTTSYTISYGAVFAAVLVARAVPRDNAAVRGLIDGANAAIERVDAMNVTPLGSTSPAAELAAG